MQHLPEIRPVPVGLPGAADVHYGQNRSLHGSLPPSRNGKRRSSASHELERELSVEGSQPRTGSRPTSQVGLHHQGQAGLNDVSSAFHAALEPTGRRGSRSLSPIPSATAISGYDAKSGSRKCFAGSEAFADVDLPLAPKPPSAPAQRGRPNPSRLPGGASAIGGRRQYGGRRGSGPAASQLAGASRPVAPAQPPSGSFRRRRSLPDASRQYSPPDSAAASPPPGIIFGAVNLSRMGSPEDVGLGGPLETPPDDAVPEEDVAATLKRLLIAKCGSLDAAFSWCDFTGTGRVTMTEWNYAWNMLASGMPASLSNARNARQLFKMMAKSLAGEVDLGAWQEFFAYKTSLDEGAIAALMTKLRKNSVPLAYQTSADDSRLESEMRAKRLGEGRLKAVTRTIMSAQGILRSRLRDVPERVGDMIKSSSVEELHARVPEGVPSLKSVLEPLSAVDDGCGVGGELTRLARSSPAVATEQDEAEAMQLAEEIEELNLNGVKALAYILCNKFGSLDKAFKWLDYNSRGFFGRVNWETGMKMLHIDVQAVTGVAPKKFFFAMDPKHKGQISKKRWDKFFTDNCDEDFDKVLESLEKQKPIKMRAAGKLKAILTQSTKKRKAGHADGDDGALNASLASLDFAASNDASGLLSSLNSSVGAGQLADSLLSKESLPSSASTGSTTAKREGANKREDSREKEGRGKKGDGKDAGAKSGRDSTGRPASSRASNQGRDSPDIGTDGPEGFRLRMQEKLMSLQPDESAEFEGLKRAERPIMDQLVSELGYWSTLCGENNSTLLVINEGTEADRIRSKIAGVKPGECLSLEGLSWQWCEYASAIAESMNLWVAPADDSVDTSLPSDVEVWNLGGSLEDFAAAVRNMLSNLKPGSVKAFPSALSMAQMGVLQDIAKEMGFYCKTLADGLHIGNLASFKADVERQLRELVPGDTQEYVGGAGRGTDLSLLHLDIAKMVVEELRAEGIVFTEESKTDDDGDITYSLTKPVSADTGATEAEATLASSWDSQTIKKRVAQLFNAYASGKKGGKKVFLRKPDLERFAREAHDAHKDSGKLDLLAIIDDLERIYDDVLQLQIDMGTRMGHGLVLDYFQVFLSKAAALFSWSLISLLFALLEKKKPE